MSFLPLLTFFVAHIAIGDMKIIKPTPVILGGDRVSIQEAPFMASYAIGWKSVCGAVILADKFVVSAAHCYDENNESRHNIKAGTDHVDKGKSHEIEKTIVHPKYASDTSDYDIVVYKLRNKLLFSTKVQPIKMADSNLIIADGAYLNVYGFGMTETGESSKYLLSAKVPFVRPNECRKYYPNLTDRMLCAGEKGKDSCKGDSGGPLVYGDTLVGLVSYGHECGEEPGVYASVSNLREFIENTMKKS